MKKKEKYFIILIILTMILNNLGRKVGIMKFIKGKENNLDNFKKILVIIGILGVLLASSLFYFYNVKSDITINIMDTNSSISAEIDDFIEKNINEAGVHTIRNDGYTYLLIVSDKIRATEMSVNLYNIYKHKFKINVEYEIEVNEDTISEDNPEKIQTMLVRFKEFGEVNPIKVNNR